MPSNAKGPNINRVFWPSAEGITLIRSDEVGSEPDAQNFFLYNETEAEWEVKQTAYDAYFPVPGTGNPLQRAGNHDWRGTINGVEFIISWDGAANRYWEASPGGNGWSVYIWWKGRIREHAPIRVSGACIRVIDGKKWIYVIGGLHLGMQLWRKPYDGARSPELKSVSNPDGWELLESLIPKIEAGNYDEIVGQGDSCFFNESGTQAVGQARVRNTTGVTRWFRWEWTATIGETSMSVSGSLVPDGSTSDISQWSIDCPNYPDIAWPTCGRGSYFYEEVYTRNILNISSSRIARDYQGDTLVDMTWNQTEENDYIWTERVDSSAYCCIPGFPDIPATMTCGQNLVDSTETTTVSHDWTITQTIGGSAGLSATFTYDFDQSYNRVIVSTGLGGPGASTGYSGGTSTTWTDETVDTRIHYADLRFGILIAENKNRTLTYSGGYDQSLLGLFCYSGSQAQEDLDTELNVYRDTNKIATETYDASSGPIGDGKVCRTGQDPGNQGVPSTYCDPPTPGVPDPAFSSNISGSSIAPTFQPPSDENAAAAYGRDGRMLWAIAVPIGSGPYSYRGLDDYTGDPLDLTIPPVGADPNQTNWRFYALGVV